MVDINGENDFREDLVNPRIYLSVSDVLRARIQRFADNEGLTIPEAIRYLVVTALRENDASQVQRGQ